MAELIRTLRERRATIAYVILSMFIVIGFIRMEVIAHRVDLESELRVESACASLDDAKHAILTIVESLVQEEPADGESTRNTTGRIVLVDRVSKILDDTECSAALTEEDIRDAMARRR